jgi:hypothetical protein
MMMTVACLEKKVSGPPKPKAMVLSLSKKKPTCTNGLVPPVTRHVSGGCSRAPHANQY